MKITVSRQEIEDMIREKYGMNSDFILEISDEKAVKRTQDIQPPSYIPQKNKPVVYSSPIKVDSSGFIVNDNESIDKPLKVDKGSHHSKKKNVKISKKCEICGKPFYTSGEARTCSPHCRSLLTAKICKEKGIKVGRHSTNKPSSVDVPANPKIDYTKYGVIIEDFLNSDNVGRTMSLDLEGLTAKGMCCRYAIAAKMFGLRDKITLSANKKFNELTMSKVEE